MNSGPPGVKSATAPEQKLPVDPELSPHPAARRSPRETEIPVAGWGGSPGSLVASDPSATETRHVIASPPPDAANALFESATAAVVRLRQSGRDEFEATVRPDDDTEIQLRVTWQGDTAEIQAELRRGDTAHLTVRWQELQDRLALHGIRLGPLQSGPGTANSHPHDHRHAHDPSTMAESPSGFRPDLTSHPEHTATALSLAPAAATTRHGWERWA